MNESKMTTKELLQKLFKTTSVKRFIKRHRGDMLDLSFHTYLKEQCAKRKVSPAYVIEKSGIERTFGHHIFGGRKNPSRDKVLQLAFGFEMNYGETQELLKFARKSTLYPKIMRDAVIIQGLERKLKLDVVQAALAELNMPLIGREGRYE
ncbi:MAG: hypothetical protein FWC73_13125 [Defluviitaleaceae bacterium]|nr:hypothetical protein [Defluviitaleaceae bacterium]